ncbi:MAG: nicotinate (nicotinamide) nucleotide adenylyltransferase [Acidobacteriota bacterium]
MKLGLFGGSFDPPHAGHVRPVREARRRLGLDRVLYLPTANPPHKADPASAPEAPAVRRFTMVELALLEEEGLYASDFELRPDRTTYTVETLEHFRAERPDAELHLILGSDSLAGLDTWRRWRDLPELARLVVLGRPGAEPGAVREALPGALRELFDGGGIDLLTDVVIDVSSTEIRRRLARGEPVPEDWMHPLVLDYVRKYSFYR